MRRKGSHLHKIEVQGEKASDDVEAAVSYPEDLTKIMQVAALNNRFPMQTKATAFYWKKRPPMTVITSEETLTSGFKVSKDRLLGINAAPDFNLKPTLIYYYETLRAFKH